MNNEPHIVIGSNRVITVPSSLKRIAVQHDHNIETVTFDCPRYWDGNDLSTMRVFITYLRSDGYIGTYMVDTVTVDDSDETIMHFDWVLSGNVTAAKGYLAFLVNIKTIDDDGNPIRHWSSELNHEMYVSEGMDSIISRYPDFVTQLLLRMEYLETVISADSIQHFIDEFLLSHDVTSAESMQAYVNRYLEANDIHSNRDVLDGITAEQITKWDRYDSRVSSNKTNIDALTDTVNESLNGVQFRVENGKLQYRYDTEVWQ